MMRLWLGGCRNGEVGGKGEAYDEQSLICASAYSLVCSKMSLSDIGFMTLSNTNPFSISSVASKASVCTIAAAAPLVVELAFQVLPPT